MTNTRKPRKYFATFALIVCMSVISWQAPLQGAPQEKHQPMETPRSSMSMDTMEQRIHQIMNETARLTDFMQESSSQQGMMGGDRMQDMSRDINHLANGIDQLMSELNEMMSSEELMMNETFKEHAERMQRQMASMVESCEAMVGSMKELLDQPKKK